MKIQFRHNPYSMIVYLAAGGWLLLAASPAGAALSQGYPANGNLPAGTVVALAPGSSGQVVAADPTLSGRLLGVVVASSGSTISLGAPNGQVQVVTTGVAAAIVSTAAGPIAAGDPLTISPVAGVGMKAASSGRIFGFAQAGFTDSSPGAQPSTSGAMLGEIPVQIGVASYSAGTGGYPVPSAIQKLANAVAGRPVALARLLIAGLILIVAIISVSVLLYSAVRNSIMAIGRNPLARKAVFRGLLPILGAVMVILTVAMASSYLVIK